MTIGPSLRLTCPHCGGYKYIESIMSGNTFRGTLWSDSKQDFPMLPSTSPIQRCPKCGKYYFYEDAETLQMDEKAYRATIKEKLSETEIEKKYRIALREWDKEASANGFGFLSEDEFREAYASLYSDSLPDKKKSNLLFSRLFAFNDEYLRGQNTLIDELNELQEEFVSKIIKMLKNNDVFAAELYREMGHFDKAIEMLRSVLVTGLDENTENAAKMILEHAENHDRTVFIIAQW